MSMKFKEFNDLPVVKPATSSANNYQDSHMKATKRTAVESERLYNILSHYEKDYESD